MKEQVQKKRTLGLDEVFFLPAWAVLLALGSCGSTPDAPEEMAPEFQLDTPVVAQEPVAPQVEPVEVEAYEVADLESEAVADEADLVAEVTEPDLAPEQDAQATPEEFLVVDNPEALEAPEEVAAPMTPAELLAAVTLTAPPTYAPKSEPKVEEVAVVEEPEKNVQKDLQSLLLSPAWQQRGLAQVAATDEVEADQSDEVVVALDESEASEHVAQDTGTKESTETEVAEADVTEESTEVEVAVAESGDQADETVGELAADGELALADAGSESSAEPETTEFTDSEEVQAPEGVDDLVAVEAPDESLAEPESSDGLDDVVAHTEEAGDEVAFDAQGEEAGDEVAFDAQGEEAGDEVAFDAQGEEAGDEVAFDAQSEDAVDVQEDAVGIEDLEGSEVAAVEEPASIKAQVDGQTFGAEPEAEELVAAAEPNQDDAPMTEFSVTWPESLEGESAEDFSGDGPEELVVDATDTATESGAEESFVAAEESGEFGSDFEEVFPLDGEPQEFEGAVESQVEDQSSELAQASDQYDQSPELDFEFKELEQTPVEFGEVAAHMMAPTFEPVLEPSLAPVARPMSFLSEVPLATRALAGPLFALDPSGLFGTLLLAGPMAKDSAGAAVAIVSPEATDPNLPSGERLAMAGTMLSDEVAKKLAEEPGLGWIWWDKSVPSQYVDNEVDIQTPSVGRIRIVLESGDYVEGLLHAVGKGLYWIDGDLGRYSVAKVLVSHVERLPKPGLGAEVEGLQAGDLVRVKMTSGYVEGRLVSAKGETILIETSDGIRMTLDNKDVKRLGDSKTRVVIP